MKIIQIGPVTPVYGGSYVGGIATHLIQLVKALGKIKLSSVILSTSKIDHSDGDVHIIGMASRLQLISLLIRNPIYFIKSLLREGKAGVIDAVYERYIKSKFSSEEVIIHVHSLHCRFADNLLDQYKVIYTDHGFWQKSGNKELLETRIKKSAQIISVSNYAKRMLIEQFPIADSKISVVYNPINKPTQEELDFSKNIVENEKIIFFNGYSETLKRKGLDLLVDSTIPNLSEEIFQVIVDDEGKDYIKSKKLKNVNVHGKLPYTKVSELYQQSKLMVLPSRSESFGIVYIESASYGVPVVGFKPMIEEFNQYLGIDIGYGFDPKVQTVDDLQFLVSKALITNWDREKIRELVTAKFSWEHLSEEFVKVYEDASK